MKLDILAITAHPDDVELTCAGTLLKHIDLGYKVGLVDLTQGELGTRGSAKIRLEEAEQARQKLGAEVRVNLGLADGFFDHREESKRKVIEQIRRFKPEIVLANAVMDRHPDHGRGSKLVSDACFLSGLVKFGTEWEGNIQLPWRPKFVYHTIQDRYIKPDFCVDISEYQKRKMEVMLSFKSQFFNPESEEPSSPISSREFLDFLEGRARDFGRSIGVEFAEGFTVERPLGVADFFDLG